MTTLYRHLRCFLHDRRGISAVEYAILIGVVGVGLVGTLATVDDSIGTFINAQFTALNGGE
jgi:Flp pilus assembly pilin Flp